MKPRVYVETSVDVGIEPPLPCTPEQLVVAEDDDET